MADIKLAGYNFNLKWEGDNIKVKASGVSVDLDTKAVVKVLDAARSVADAGLLKTLTGVSLAAYLAVRSATKTWGWLQATDPPTTKLLQLSAPEDKKAEFDKLIKDGELEKKMLEPLENPRQAIRNDLDSSVSQTTVDELAERLEDIHLSSVTRCTDEHGGMVQGKIVKGKLTVVAHDQVEIIAPTSGSGNVIGQTIEAGAEANYTYRGGVQMIGGVSEAIQRHAIETVAGNKIQVSLKFSDHSAKFEAKYKPDQTVYDIIVEVVEDMKKKKNSKKFKHIKAKTEEVVDEDMTIMQLQEKGWLKTMTVLVE